MHALGNLVLSSILTVIILGGPLTLYAVIKILNNTLAKVRVRFVRSGAAAEEKAPIGILVSWDDQSFPLALCRIKVDFTELVRGGRSTSFSFTFEDKAAKKRSFMLPIKLSDDDYAMLTDNGIGSSARSVQRSYMTVEVEDTKGNTLRRRISKGAILSALHDAPFRGPSDNSVEVAKAMPSDSWLVQTRVFAWRKVKPVEATAAAPGEHKPKAKGPAAPTIVDFIVTKVWIEPGCIVCDACENEAPEVFHVTKDTCIVRENAPLGNAASIKAAAEGCPVDVIKYDSVKKPA